jgi:DNA modification methylase
MTCKIFCDSRELKSGVPAHLEQLGAELQIKSEWIWRQIKANGVPHDSALNHPKGKNPGDVWYIPTAPYPESHFAVFPLELVRRPILAGCPVGGTVLDPFGGSGTVGEFCRNNERNAILFELNPEYLKLINERAMITTPKLSSWCSAKTDA